MRILTLLLFLVVFWPKCQSQDAVNNTKQRKIGLSLSGGGAKGFVHIGVLKVIDSLGVKVDYISGTSMGAIVGGLYASGFKAKDIEKIVFDTDFYSLITNEKNRQETTFFNKVHDKYLLTLPVINGKINVIPKAISTGQKNIYMLEELFKNVSNIEDFSKLPIPFMCIGTNLESGKMEIFEKGDLVKAIMASSAFPSLMDPVKIGDSIYIDGAMTLNYPSKPLKDKDMDLIIGVDLSQPLAKREELNSVVSILNQIIDFDIRKETDEQYQYVDINIHPDLTGLSATSYDQKEKIVKLGYDEALKYVDQLKLLPKVDKQLRVSTNSLFSNVYKIDDIILENNKIFDENYVLGKMELQLPSMQTYGTINNKIEKLYATNNYQIINYDIIQENGKNILKLMVNEDESRYFLRAGLHYDEVFKTGLLLNATIKRLLLKNSTISLDIVLGDQPRYYFNYSMDNGYIPGIGLYSSGMSFNIKDVITEELQTWNWFRNDVFLQSIWKNKFAIGGGFSHDYFESRKGTTVTGNFINPYIFVKSDTQDDKNFPNKGFFMDIEGKYLDMLNSVSEEKFFQTKAKFNFNIPINSNFTYQINLFGGFTSRDEITTFYKFRAGGIFEQKLGNFASFPGLNIAEYVNDNMVIATQALQFRFKKNFYLSTTVSLINIFDNIKIKDVFHVDQASAGLTLGYRSPFGPIKLNYSKVFNKNNKGIFNVVLGYWF